MQNKKLWFKAKSFGWGWTPCSWEGWLVMFFWALSNIIYFSKVEDAWHTTSNTLILTSPFFIASILILIIICYRTGETPEWRWGIKKQDK